MHPLWSALYTILIGIPLCCACIGIGIFLCLTIIGIAPGLTLIALGIKMLTISPKQPRYM